MSPGGTATSLAAGLRRRARGTDPERGSAVVEFLAGTIVLLVPLVYLVLTLAELQAAAFAAEGAARDTGRIVATSSDPATAAVLAERGVELAFADHGIEVDGADALAVSCAPSCSTPGAVVTVTVAVDVALPLWPDGSMSVPISSQAVSSIDAFRERS